jgi:hypothetical protein
MDLSDHGHRVTSAEEVDGGELLARRAVLVPVGTFDHRAVAGVRTAALVPAAERRAVHAAVDPTTAEALALRWMYGHPALAPLDIVDDDGGIAATVADVAAKTVADGWDQVVVVVARLVVAGRLRQLLHNGTGAAVVRALEGKPRIMTVTVPVFATGAPDDRR